MWNKVPRTKPSDMKGEVVVITGVAENSLGFFMAQQMLNNGAKVIVGSRNPDFTQTAVDILIHNTKNPNIEIRQVDMSSLKSVQSFCDDLKKDLTKIDVLINNAGINDQSGLVSKDGYELCFQVNYLGVVAMTESLLPLLNKGRGRIVHTSSSASEIAKSIDIDDIQGKNTNGGYFSYARSKIVLNMYSVDLQKRLTDAKSHVTSVTFHPGTCYTNIWVKSIPQWIYVLVEFYFFLRMRSARDGAETGVFLACSDDIANGGHYFYNKKVKTENELVKDDKLRAALWKRTREILNL